MNMKITCPCCGAEVLEMKLAPGVPPSMNAPAKPPVEDTSGVFIGDVTEVVLPDATPQEPPIPFASFLPEPSDAEQAQDTGHRTQEQAQPPQGVDIESLKCSDCEHFPTMPLGASCRTCCKADKFSSRLNYQLAANKRPGAMPHEGCNGCKHVGLTFAKPPCDTCIAQVSGLRFNWEAL